MKQGTNFKLFRKVFFGVFILTLGLLANAKAQVVTGVDTLNKVSGIWEYYDFTSSKSFTIADTVTYTPDFWGSSNEGVNFGKEFSSIIPEKRLYLLGDGDIDTVKTVPIWTDAAPWVDTSWDFTNGTQGQPISPDQLWVVYTSEGLYAVMQIDELPDGNFGDSFTFKFKYMSEGGTTLEETNLNEDEQTAEIQISGVDTETGFAFTDVDAGSKTSANNTYQVTGVNLEGDIEIESMALSGTHSGFDLSLTGTSFSGSLTVPQGEATDKVVTVRAIVPANNGRTYQGKITHTTTNGETVEIPVTVTEFLQAAGITMVEPLDGSSTTIGSDITINWSVSNLVNEQLTLEYSLDQTIWTEITTQTSGLETYSFNTEFLAEGTYYLRISAKDLPTPVSSSIVSIDLTEGETGGEQISGSATSTSGSGFDFSREETGDNIDAGDYQLDFAFVNNEGVNFGNEGSNSLSGTGRRFLLLGNGNIDTVKTVPTRTDAAPWVIVSYDFSNGTQGQPISVGQLWAVYTREGHYAVMEITALPEGNFGSSFDFKYKYQPNGTSSFEGTVIDDPQPTILVIAGGQNQITVLGDTITTSMEIIVLDDIGEPMNGINVTFEELSIPEGSVSGKFFTPDGINLNKASTFNNRAYMDYSLGDTEGDYLIQAFLANYPAVDSVVFTISGELTKAPLNFVVNANGPVVDLSWDQVEGAKEYNVYRALNDDNPASASLLATVSGTKFVDDNVVGGETYFYQVFSVEVFGNESEQGAGPLSATPVEEGDVIMGSSTVQQIEGSWQYFDFSAGIASNTDQTDDFFADFRGTSNEGVNFGREGAPIIEGNRIIKLSGEGLASITSIPNWTNETPWIGTSWQGEGTNGQPLSEGQLWGVYTSEGHYAAMEITEVPDAFGSSFSFSYKYQPSGSNLFGDVEPIVPDTLIIVSGDDQIGNPGTTLSQPLMVEVQDENGEKLEGVTVTFSITNLPEGAMGGGLNASSVITTSGGVARVILTLSDKVGDYEVTAKVEGLEPVIFSATAIETPAPEPVTLLEIRDGLRPNSLIPEWRQSQSENFLYYKVYLSTEGGDLQLVDSTRVGTGFRQDTSAAIGDLIALQEYTFAVSVVNADGQESELSNSLTSFPKPTPEMPANVMAVAGDGAVQLNWDANDSTYFDFYYVYSGLDGQSITANDTLFSVTDTSLVIGGLENDEIYQFYVIAVNRFGKESDFPQKITATPTSSLVEVETDLPSLINGASSWADVDNDSDLDLIMTGQVDENTEPVSLLFLNDGDGNFTDSNNDIIGLINSTLYWYDIDQNGYVDLIISGENADGVITKVYLNEEGTLTDAGFALPGLANGMVAPGDFDSDGDLDFLIAGESDSGSETVLIRNTGNGTFVPVEFPFIGFTKAAASWGDYNADGRLDFIISGEVDGGSIVTMIYRNTGNGTFVVGESSIQGVISGTVAFTDLDLDTDLDILVTGFTNQEKTTTFTGLYKNTGLDFELFYSATNPPSKAMAIANKSRKAVIGDYDNDGDPDILVSSKSGASILKNNRGSIKEQILNLGIEGSVTWADYDGDGDLDIIATGSGADGATSKILSNKTLIRNTSPTSPKNLMAEVLMDTVKLSWGMSSDAQTPSKSLTYNVRIGRSSGTSNVLSANADIATGKLRIQANGNAGFSRELLLQGLPNGTYFWQVQAVDNSFLGSMFSSEMEFTVTNSLVSNEEITSIPAELKLSQNYPNPFNPSTNIEFSVQSNSLVTLQVFDITGRLVGSLVNEQKTAGEYSARFDARNLASGLYIYRLQVGRTIITKKMTLIK